MVIPSDSTGEVTTCAHCPERIGSVDGTWRHLSTGLSLTKRCAGCGGTNIAGVPGGLRWCRACGPASLLITDHVAEPPALAVTPPPLAAPRVGGEIWTTAERPNGGIILSILARADDPTRYLTYWPKRPLRLRLQTIDGGWDLVVSEPDAYHIVDALRSMAREVVDLLDRRPTVTQRAHDLIGWMHQLAGAHAGALTTCRT